MGNDEPDPQHHPTPRRRSRSTPSPSCRWPTPRTIPSTEYLSDGITEGIINQLSQLPKLKVMARSTVFRYKNRDADAQSVGRELRVRAVLTGVVKHVGDRLQISVELVDSHRRRAALGRDATTASSPTCCSCRRRCRARSPDKLRLKLTGAEKKKLRKKHHREQRGLSALSQRPLPLEQAHRGGPAARHAVLPRSHRVRSRRSPCAYAGLADCFITLATNIPLPPRETMPKAKAAAMRAIEIDDGLAEAWASLGAVRWWFDWDWEGAEEAYRRAIALNPELRHRARRLRDAALRARTVRRGGRADLESLRPRSAVADHRRARGLAVLLRARLRIGHPAFPQGARARREFHPRPRLAGHGPRAAASLRRGAGRVRARARSRPHPHPHGHARAHARHRRRSRRVAEAARPIS